MISRLWRARKETNNLCLPCNLALPASKPLAIPSSNPPLFDLFRRGRQAQGLQKFRCFTAANTKVHEAMPSAMIHLLADEVVRFLAFRFGFPSFTLHFFHSFVFTGLEKYSTGAGGKSGCLASKL